MRIKGEACEAEPSCSVDESTLKTLHGMQGMRVIMRDEAN